MIVQVLVFSPLTTEVIRIVHAPLAVESHQLQQLVHRTSQQEVVGIDPDFGMMRLTTMRLEMPSGLELTVGVAVDRGTAVVVVGDALEPPASVRVRAGMVLAELQSRFEEGSVPSLDGAERRDLISSINEVVFERVKIVLFGGARTGKTSVFRLASRGSVVNDYVPSTRVAQAPPVGAYWRVVAMDDLSASEEWFHVSNKLIMLYDLPGRRPYQRAWRSYLRRADVAVLVLDSSKLGVVEARRLLMAHRRFLPRSVIAIANFQDVEGAVPPPVVSRFLGIEAYDMVATDIDRCEQLRDIFKTVAVYELEGPPEEKG